MVSHQQEIQTRSINNHYYSHNNCKLEEIRLRLIEYRRIMQSFNQKSS